MTKNYYICIFYSKGNLNDIFIHDNKFFYPLIDPFNYGLKPSKLMLKNTNDNFINHLKKNSVKIKQEIFNELKNSDSESFLNPKLRSILIMFCR